MWSARRVDATRRVFIMTPQARRSGVYKPGARKGMKAASGKYKPGARKGHVWKVAWPASWGPVAWVAEPGDRFEVEVTGPATLTILRCTSRH